ncbi:MAG: hypothetical protein ABIN94_05630 [Ferruginibacter sp.]
MNKDDQINKWVEDTINSVDDINRAVPKPFLLTRIKARINHSTETMWEKTGWFVGRPVFAVPMLVMLIIINCMVIAFNKPGHSSTVTEQLAQSTSDEFSFTVSSIYDIENPEP